MALNEVLYLSFAPLIAGHTYSFGCIHDTIIRHQVIGFGIHLEVYALNILLRQRLLSETSYTQLSFDKVRIPFSQNTL